GSRLGHAAGYLDHIPQVLSDVLWQLLVLRTALGFVRAPEVTLAPLLQLRDLRKDFFVAPPPYCGMVFRCVGRSYGRIFGEVETRTKERPRVGEPLVELFERGQSPVVDDLRLAVLVDDRSEERRVGIESGQRRLGWP